MKRFVPLFLALVLLALVPLASLAEANVALNPDDSWWGMSRTKFKETFGDVSFEEVTVDRHKALALRAVDIGSLTVDVYFDFAQREAGKAERKSQAQKQSKDFFHQSTSPEWIDFISDSRGSPGYRRPPGTFHRRC